MAALQKNTQAEKDALAAYDANYAAELKNWEDGTFVEYDSGFALAATGAAFALASLF